MGVHVSSRSRSAPRVFYRFVTGMELDGVRRTNATWRRPGRDLQDGVRHAWRWHYLPRNQRAMWRHGVIWVAALLGWSAWISPVQTWYAIQGLLALSCCVFAHWFWTVIKVYENRHRFLGPLAVVLAARWRFTPPNDPTTWITVPVDCRTNGDHPVEIIMPADYRETDRQMEASAKVIARKVGIPITAMDYELDPLGDHPKMLVRAQEVPPEFIDFEMAREYLEQATDTRYFFGLGLRGKPMWIDLDQDSPHIAFSFGSGGGKSTVIRLLAAQVLRLGGRVVILDHAKEGDSHADWVYDDHGNLLPGVEFYTETETVHEALIGLEEERARRSRAAHQAKRFKRTPPHFQRVFVVMEEMNTGTPMLTDYWKQLRKELMATEKAETGEAGEQPLRSPAMQSTAALVNAGRAQRMNVGAVAQRFDAKVIGGGDVRASFMVRVLARFGDDARKMLIPTVEPKPKSSNHPGRMTLAAESEAEVLQAVFLTPSQAQEWALGGYREVLEQGGVVDSQSLEINDLYGSEQAERDSESPGRARLELPPVLEPEVELVTLTEALERGLSSCTIDNLRWHSRQDSFPVGRGKRGNAKTYAAHDLADWESRRVRRGSMSR